MIAASIAFSGIEGGMFDNHNDFNSNGTGGFGRIINELGGWNFFTVLCLGDGDVWMEDEMPIGDLPDGDEEKENADPQPQRRVSIRRTRQIPSWEDQLRESDPYEVKKSSKNIPFVENKKVCIEAAKQVATRNKRIEVGL